jgi:hypothetical protein
MTNPIRASLPYPTNITKTCVILVIPMRASEPHVQIVKKSPYANT